MSGYYVGDDYRTNPSSLIPGGSTVVVEYYSGEIRAYDKIKNSQAYIKSIIKDINIKTISVDGHAVWHRDTY